MRALALALAWILLAGLAAPVAAQSQRMPVPAFWFAGTQLIFARADRVDDEIAVAASDPGFRRFLARVGATLSWVPGSRYVIVTTADRRTLTFTLGVPEFQSGAGNEQIPLHAYIDGNDVYLPFLTLARALYVKPVLRGDEYVLEPQIGALDARVDGRRTIVALHGAVPLQFTTATNSSEQLSLVFHGTASTLERARWMAMPGLGRIDVSVSGDVRNPSTTITFQVPPGAARALLVPTNPDEIVLAFAPKDVALGSDATPLPPASTVVATVAQPPAPPASPVPENSAPRIIAAAPPTFAPSPAPPVEPLAPLASPSGTPFAQSSPVASFVSAVNVENPAPDALLIHIVTSPGLSFEWHRLGIDRFYIDFTGATLSFEPQSAVPGVTFVQSYRINQLPNAPIPTVRLALTTTPNRRIDVVPDAHGLTITVADVDAGQGYLAQVGTGQTGGESVAAVPSAVPLGTPPPGAAPPAGANPRLIVIDPGHGGTDSGAVHNGLTEKILTLDIALRLRTLLEQRGWIVKMTRETDRDVYGPNASDVDELQARVDVANNAGARLFVSIHCNASTSSVPSGTTSYWYKPQDKPLAEAIQHRLIALLGTKDDGIVRERLYVVRRTTMPATLVETAFVSNPDDAARLRSPAFRQEIALGIADGIQDYAGQPAASLSEQQ